MIWKDIPNTVLNYLQGKSKGYLNKNISSIKYL